MPKKLFFFLLAFSFAHFLSAQKTKPAARIAFWNVENLFDTINDPKINDEEFLPNGKMKWTSERYNTKIDHLSKAILALGVDGKGPDVLGMSEVENENVLIDLTQKTELKKQNYGIVHYDSPDKRGIDVALIYKKNKFRVLSSEAVHVPLPVDTIFTRDILVVKGIIAKKDTVYIFVNHWPSRLGGSEKSEERRIFAARELAHIQDSILKLHPKADLIAIGDFNDEPTDKSLQSLSCKNGNANCLVNLMDPIKDSGDGSHYYKKEKSMFDQVLVSKNLTDRSSYIWISQAHIFRPAWIMGEVYKGDPPAPLRTYAGTRYVGGYSDHLPVYADILLSGKKE